MARDPYPLMIDSGAFSVWRRGVTINIQEYIAYCLDLQSRHPHVICVNLDVIGDGKGSYQNWRIMEEAGVKTLPVFHPNSDPVWLKKYLDKTDHIGLGAMGLRPVKLKPYLDRVWKEFLTDPKTRLPTVKVHGMAITTFHLMARYPWYSVDSTSWAKVGGFGDILVPRPQGHRWDYSRPPRKFAFSTLSPRVKERGRHFSTLSPIERGILLRYLKETGFILGFETKQDPLVRLVGVATKSWERKKVCLEFFASFTGHLPYPRTLLHKGENKWWNHQDEGPTTIFYASGGGLKPETYIENHRDRHPHVGFLFSYFDMTKGNIERNRLAYLLGE